MGRGLSLLPFFIGTVFIYTVHVIGFVGSAIGQPHAGLMKSPQLNSASWGFVVLSEKTGKTLFAKNPGLTLSPASTMKVLTTAAALATLGKRGAASGADGFHFETKLLAEGSITNGELEGNLLVVGTGDPTLGGGRAGIGANPETVLKRWVVACSAAGVRSIKGKVLVLGGHFLPPHHAPDVLNADMANYFGAGVFGVNWRENFFTCTVRSGATGEASVLQDVKPVLAGYTIDNRVVAGASGSGDQGYFYGVPGKKELLLTGSVPPNRAGFALKGALPDPGAQLGYELFTALKDAGITVKDGFESNSSQTPEQVIPALLLPQGTGLKVLDVLPSPPLPELVRLCNMNSLNLYAEALQRSLPGKASFVSNKGSHGYGILAHEAILKAIGLDMNGLFIQDGSGLAPTDGVTPLHLAKVMRLALADSATGAAMLASLPVLGKTGTLAAYGKGSKAEGRVQAKTGTLTRGLCYVGRAIPAKGEQVIFALMVNRYTGTYEAMRAATIQVLINLGAGER
jgi:serine-type D-Ala-D-Ala carboxypeptidase/endopeptidase (penicillin-binding protein 4)